MEGKRMTITEALERVDALVPNQFEEQEKLKWLSSLDWTIKVEIIDIRQNGVSFSGYNAETDMNTKLLAPEPYDEMYIHWMTAMIDYNNREMAGYNNAIARFEEMYTKFRNWYNRNHMAKNTPMRYF
jgi:hypothetical protein